MMIIHRGWHYWAILVCLLSAVPATAATPERDAVYRERNQERTMLPADRCADAGTQAALNECAFQSFLETSAAMSQQLRSIETALTPARRQTWRQVQKAWLTFRTKTCQFEAGAVGQGSARQMVQWQCADRLTKQRIAELSRLAECSEGTIGCPVPTLRKTP
ncbi:MAG: lysozyme inhibitor LprI family protein [Pseudomonadota bacterium]